MNVHDELRSACEDRIALLAVIRELREQVVPFRALQAEAMALHLRVRELEMLNSSSLPQLTLDEREDVRRQREAIQQERLEMKLERDAWAKERAGLLKARNTPMRLNMQILQMRIDEVAAAMVEASQQIARLTLERDELKSKIDLAPPASPHQPGPA